MGTGEHGPKPSYSFSTTCRLKGQTPALLAACLGSIQVGSLGADSETYFP
ncbi:hypothetical protein CDEST_11695 [Colletotrichum destructivum]|uniref:Uncharacterized protein n=1 Tax=Colletotrichum destructivum TaxID=34406 RepID=A0AAX4IU39_9PEZI|nr:hypothetical protein CDEST_11695 [Colletotrichum destructivum]